MPEYLASHHPRKRFGQHFLTDQQVLVALLEAIDPEPYDASSGSESIHFVEIGPGLGALTEPLLARVGRLQAVELDRDLALRLRRRFGAQLVLHQADALKFDFQTLLPKIAAQSELHSTPTSEQPLAHSDSKHSPSLRIVGNLPYNISTPLLFHLSHYADQVIDQHFMLQSEVVERMIAAPGSKAYGRLSVMLQYRYTMEKCFDVPPEAFDPPPKVQSAVVRMMPIPLTLSLAQQQTLEALVRTAFSQRRKILRNTLGAQYPHQDFKALDFDLNRRAEEVAVQEYVRLAQQIFNDPSIPLLS